jgi:addiction module HigA family antidote
MAKRQIPLAIPGEILLEEFLKPLSHPVPAGQGNRRAAAPHREIVASKRTTIADAAARLGVFFGMEAEFWLNLQAHYDLALTREALAENLAAIQRWRWQRESGVAYVLLQAPGF